MTEISLYFLRLGCIGFGGPLALVAMMQRELVQQKQWMTEDEFRQIFALIKAMPGPVAFQVAVFLGHHRGRLPGGFLAGLGLVLPAFVLMILLGIFYQTFVEVPWIHALMKGMQIGAFALIVMALKSLAQSFIKKSLFWLLLVSGVVLTYFTSVPEPLLILMFGLVAIAARRLPSKSVKSVELTLLLVSLKAGAFVFGTGLAIVPFLEADFVSRLGWLTREQFMDALAFGQLTPGPVVITVTFIGYKVAGFKGALLATAGVFLPAFLHMVTWFPRLAGWLKKQTWIGAFTLGVTAAVCSAILLALVPLSKGWAQFEFMGLAALLVAMNYLKIPTWAVILISGAGGLVSLLF